MILRRITSAFKRQDWFTVGIETLIVVLGVFLGLQVNNWNAARNDRKEAREYITRIQEDLRITQTVMKNNEQFAAWVKQHMMGAIDALESGKPDLGAPFVVDAYVSAHNVSGAIQRDAYDELVSVGALGKIHDPAVRQRIAQFYRSADASNSEFSKESDYLQKLRRAMPYHTIAMLRHTCAAEPHVDDRGAVTFRIPDTCPPDLTPLQLQQAVASLRAADLLPSLREAVGVLEAKESTYQPISHAAGDLDKFLEAHNK